MATQNELMSELKPFLTTCVFWPKGMGFIRANALTLRAAFGVAYISLRPNQWFIHLTPDHKQKRPDKTGRFPLWLGTVRNSRAKNFGVAISVKLF